jgi:hypothetical protein
MDDMQHHLEQHIDTQIEDLKELVNTRVEYVEDNVKTLDARMCSTEKWQFRIIAACLIIGIAIREAWERLKDFF